MYWHGTGHVLVSGEGQDVPPFCGVAVIVGALLCVPVGISHVVHSCHAKTHGVQSRVLSGGHTSPLCFAGTDICTGCV